MKYFIEGISEEQWANNMSLYWKNFDSLKSKLSSETAEIFSSKHLHDSEITAVLFKKEKAQKNNVYDLIVSIKNEVFEGDIVHQDVCLYFNSYSDTSKYKYLCEYLYGEILYENHLWIHNIKYSQDNELSVQCKKIQWIKRK